MDLNIEYGDVDKKFFDISALNLELISKLGTDIDLYQ
jgi:hypothetical protein